MGNAAVLGISRGRSSSAFLLPHSGGLISSSSPLLITPRFCSRLVFAHFSSSSKAGRRSSSSPAKSPIGGGGGAEAATSSELRNCAVEEGSASKMTDGGPDQGPAMVLTTTEAVPAVIGTKFEDLMIEKVMANLIEVHRNLTNLNKTLKKLEGGIQELKSKFGEMNFKLEKLKNERKEIDPEEEQKVYAAAWEAIVKHKEEERQMDEQRKKAFKKISEQWEKEYGYSPRPKKCKPVKFKLINGLNEVPTIRT